MNDTLKNITCLPCTRWGPRRVSKKADLKRQLVATQISDGDEHKHGFETIRSARAEDRVRRERLASFSMLTDIWPKRLRDLVPTLEAVLENSDHKAGWAANAASSVEMRSGRRVTVGAMLQGFASYSDDQLRSFTIMNAKWIYTPRQLAKLKLPALIGQLRTHMRRAGVFDAPGPLAAFVHGEFDPVHGVFTLHFHGITTVEKAEKIMLLKGHWGYEKHPLTNSPPIRRPRITDRPRQFSYCLKSYWPSKGIRWVEGKWKDGVWVKGKWKRDRGGKRVPEPFHTMYLAWLSQFQVSDLRLLIGCRVMPCGHTRIEG